MNGESPLPAWREVLGLVCREGERLGSIRELVHLTVVAERARPLTPREIGRYKQLVGREPWDRVTRIYSRGMKLAWKPSYIGRLTEWPDGARVVDQLGAIAYRASRTPGSKALCACVLHPRDLRRSMAASIPCLLGLDFKIRRGAVHVAAFFRSQDVFRLFLGDYHYVASIARGLVDTLNSRRAAGGEALSCGDLVFHVCSAHLASKTARRLAAGPAGGDLAGLGIPAARRWGRGRQRLRE